MEPEVRKSVSRETAGSGLNQAVMRRLSRISQHFLGAKASSGAAGLKEIKGKKMKKGAKEWADSATEAGAVWQFEARSRCRGPAFSRRKLRKLDSLAWQEKKKKRKKKDGRLEGFQLRFQEKPLETE